MSEPLHKRGEIMQLGFFSSDGPCYRRIISIIHDKKTNIFSYDLEEATEEEYLKYWSEKH